MGEKHKLFNRVERSGYKKKYIAEKLGISDVLFSLYINGKRDMPDHIKNRLTGILM